jgi:hypothetical protein
VLPLQSLLGVSPQQHQGHSWALGKGCWSLGGRDREKNQIDGSKAKPGDITVQQYHRGFASSAFDITISHPLQKKFIEIAMEEAGVVAEEAHDRKLKKSLEVCQKEGIHFVPLAWESTGGATETVHETVRKWTELEGARGGYPRF